MRRARTLRSAHCARVHSKDSAEACRHAVVGEVISKEGVDVQKTSPVGGT